MAEEMGITVGQGWGLKGQGASGQITYPNMKEDGKRTGGREGGRKGEKEREGAKEENLRLRRI